MSVIKLIEWLGIGLVLGGLGAAAVVYLPWEAAMIVIGLIVLAIQGLLDA